MKMGGAIGTHASAAGDNGISSGSGYSSNPQGHSKNVRIVLVGNSNK
jgi:hypothetical protein